MSGACEHAQIEQNGAEVHADEGLTAVAGPVHLLQQQVQRGRFEQTLVLPVNKHIISAQHITRSF